MSILKDAIKKILNHEQEDPVKMKRHATVGCYSFCIKREA
jgi:hypothetical protein